MEFQNEKHLMNQLKNHLKNIAKKGDFAAFDADGTLWFEDANQILLDYQLAQGLREGLREVLDPQYREESLRHKRCQLFAEKQAGLGLPEFRSQCRAAFKAKPLQLFRFQKELLEYLKQLELRVCIVTSSISYLVEEVVQNLCLPVEKVIGVEPKLKDGRLSSQLEEPAPLGNRKGEAFLQYSRGKACVLAGGNSSSDLPLLKMAHIAFVVGSAEPGHENHLGEKNLLTQALDKGWMTFQKKH